LHEVAAGSLDANLDEVGYGGHAARWGYRFFYGTLESINRAERYITTAPLQDADGEEVIDRHRIRYDYLVLAIGGVSNDFGIPGVREHAMFLEQRTQADTFRHKLLNACFRANLESAGGKTDSKVRICIVGGGATGVELSAELFNAAKGLRNYGLEVFDEKALDVTLLEAGPRILPALDEELAETARSELEALGVKIRTATQVVRMEPKTVHTKDGSILTADLILWAAGVRGAYGIEAMSDLELNRLGQFIVHPTLQTVTDDRVFAIGDCASCTLPGEERPIPPRAQSAHQMAATVYGNLRRLMEGRTPEPFRYRDHGSLVSLSRFAAVGSLMGNLVGGRMAIEGRLARMAYRSLYRMHILAIHGWLKGSILIVIGHVNHIVRPRLKLH
jgi:NADH dehydrogenase